MSDLQSLILLTFLLFIEVVNSAKILCILPVPSISHQVVYRGLTRELARRGHELVIITSEPVLTNETLYKNVQQINIHDLAYKAYKESIDFSKMGTKYINNIDFCCDLANVKRVVFDEALEHPEVKRLIDDQSQRFDLLIVEIYIDAFLYLTKRFQAPVIGIASALAPLEEFVFTESTYHPAFYSDLFVSEDIDSGLSLIDRLAVVKDHYVQWDCVKKYQALHHATAVKHFGKDTPTLKELTRNMSISFMATSPMSIGIRPLPPTVINLGDIYLESKLQLEVMDSRLESLLNESSQGVIYFSLGTNVRSTDITRAQEKIIKETFSELPYTILWKWDDPKMADQPNNVHISSLWPQYKILTHPNTKLLITHGGRQSLDEAIAAAVPIIGLPLWYDQPRNIQHLVRRGAGRKLEMKTLNKDEFKSAILDIIQNATYKNNMEKYRRFVNDIPYSGLDGAVFWIEYVLHHGPMDALKPYTISFHEYLFLDVIAFVVVQGCILLTLSYFLIKFIY